MTIADVISKYNGTVLDANEFWPDGALDPNEVIVELPWDTAWLTFTHEFDIANNDPHNPIQYVADDENGTARYFLYYAE